MILRKDRLNDALNELKPDFLHIENESQRHRVPPGSESHFKITMVASAFESLSRVNRHRLMHTLLAEEFSSGLHALSLHLFTPSEWAKNIGKTPNSPPCHQHKVSQSDLFDE